MILAVSYVTFNLAIYTYLPTYNIARHNMEDTWKNILEKQYNEYEMVDISC